MSFWLRVEQACSQDGWLPWIGFGFVVGTLLLMSILPACRRRLRTVLLLFLCALAIFVLAGALLARGAAETGLLFRVTRFVAELLEAIAIIQLASVALFAGMLRRLRLEPPHIVQDLVIACAYVVIAFVLLAQAGVDLRGIVATSAVLTAIVGFSLQDSLGNIMGGVALQLERTVRSGDWIRLDNVEGRVRQIRWRQTSLETRDGDTVVVPNSALIKNRITLLGRREGAPLHRRQWVRFEVDLSHSPTRVIAAVENALRAEPIPNVASEPEPHCLVTQVEDGEGMYALRYWLTELTGADATDSLIRTRIYAALQRAHISFSIPAQTVILTEEHARRERIETEDAKQRNEAVQGLEFFHPLTDDERSELAAGLLSAPFVRGEAMTRQGAQANWLYIIVEGEAEVRVSVDGVSKRVATLRGGDYFGEMGLMTGEPRSATVIALSDVKCYRLSKEVFEKVLKRRKELAEKLSVTLAQRRMHLEEVKEEISQEAYREQMLHTQGALLRRIRDFFGLEAEKAA